MQTLETMKSKSQESINRLVKLGKEQPSEVKTWGVTAGAAVVGGIAMTAGAQGLLAIFATLASLPVSLTVGAIGGGVLGWLYLEQKKTANKAAGSDEASSLAPEPQAVTVEILMPEASSEVVSSESPIAATNEFVVASDSSIPSRGGEPLLIIPEAVTENQPIVVTSAEPAADVVPELPAQQDNLEEIAGIGPVFAAQLQAVGIHTFVQLAALSPEQLLELMAPSRGGHLIDAPAWIEQARQLATSAAE